jgi:hypothetical protein
MGIWINGWISSTPTKAVRLHRQVRHQADLLRIIAKSSHASTSTLASTYLRLLLTDRAGSSSPTSFVVIITDNHLHHQHRNIVAAVTSHGQRQTPTKSSPSPTSDAAQLQSENPGLNPDNFYHYN